MSGFFVAHLSPLFYHKKFPFFECINSAYLEPYNEIPLGVDIEMFMRIMEGTLIEKASFF